MSKLEPLNPDLGLGLDNAKGFAQIGRSLRDGDKVNHHAQIDLWNYCLQRLEIIWELEAENDRLKSEVRKRDQLLERIAE